ncbi:MAG: LysR family transcriptional regulator [Pseudomonadota bacterium]
MRIFLAVARRESLTRAGQILRMDAATVGRRIARLEHATGTSLFLKSPQGYTLTESGQALVADAEAAEAAMEQASSRLTGREGLSGTFRIGAPDGCANYLLPQVCADIAAENPGIEVQILALPRVVDLSRREADLAITVSQPKTGRILAERLADYRLSLAASEAWIAAHGLPSQLSDLRGARMIGYIPDMIFDAELDYLAELGLTHVPLASNAVSVQLNWARTGAGLAVVHDFALRAAPELRRILADKVALRRTFWMLRPAGGQRDARLARFAERLAHGVRAELTRLEGHARDFGNA